MKTKALFVAAVLLLAAPALGAEPPSPKDAPAAATDNQAQPAPATDNQAQPARGTASQAQPARPPVYISMDFTDVDLPVLIKFISEQTRRNFIFDERVSGKITIISPRKITVDEAYNVFISVLQVKGFAVIEQGNASKIVPLREAKQDNLPTSREGEARVVTEFVTRLIPLQYVDASEVVGIFAQLVSKDGLVTPFPSSNTLLVIDSSSNIDRILRIIGDIDVPATGATVRIYVLKHASAAEVGRMLEQLFQEAPGAPAGAKPRAGRSARTRGAGFRVLTDARTNSLIILAGIDLHAEIEDLLRKIDIATPENTGKINVYYLENSDAEEIAKVLASLTERKATPGAAPAPGQPPSTIKGVISAELEGGVRITADKATNSLIVIASANDYQTIIDVIKKLDIRRRQVYVEGLIMEITLDKARDIGTEFRTAIATAGNGAVIGGTNFDFLGNVNDFFKALVAGNPLLFSGSGLIAGGIGGNVVLPDGTEVPAITGILRAAQSHENVNVLSTPHLLTLDNKEAEIIVGENVPFITSQARDTTTTNLSNVINTIERKDVGVTLRITPHIHESDYVNLDIYQESSAVKGGESVLLTREVGPTTTKRSAKTSVLVKNGDTVVLGGMMQETYDVIERKVPLLGDIPLLGWLFKFKSTSSKKTNLLILLTPRVIKDPGVMAGQAIEQRKKMDRFIEENRGEVDRVFPEIVPSEKK